MTLYVEFQSFKYLSKQVMLTHFPNREQTTVCTSMQNSISIKMHINWVKMQILTEGLVLCLSSYSFMHVYSKNLSGEMFMISLFLRGVTCVGMAFLSYLCKCYLSCPPELFITLSFQSAAVWRAGKGRLVRRPEHNLLPTYFPSQSSLKKVSRLSVGLIISIL